MLTPERFAEIIDLVRERSGIGVAPSAVQAEAADQESQTGAGEWIEKVVPMIRWLRRFLCTHENQDFVRNIYGDMINLTGGKRSEWLCRKCGATVFKAHLNLFGERLQEFRKAIKSE